MSISKEPTLLSRINSPEADLSAVFVSVSVQPEFADCLAFWAETSTKHKVKARDPSTINRIKVRFNIKSFE
jgi:hypothetical protein